MNSLNKNTAKGMRDFLPAEKEFRERLLAVIRNTYALFGFSEIETPCVEDINNLLSRQGGDNEKLIYKILKRGERAEDASGGELCDLGLRFDLTVPLARYCAANGASLPAVFKAVQIGNVWRAERPQKGRFRQFVQCDIDIIGDETGQAETELILASCAALRAAGLSNFTVVINDRRILKAAAAKSGIGEDKTESAFMALDKFDKIGADGDVRELVVRGIDKKAAEKLTAFAADASFAKNTAEYANLTAIIGAVQKGGGNIKFNGALVRGMGYYTGPIFEIVSQDFDSSIAGGGRYDEMLGRFSGKKIPACGISVGFERIAALLAEKGVGVKTVGKAVIFTEPGYEAFLDAHRRAEELRSGGKVCLVVRKNKNFSFQKEQLKQEGYAEFFVNGKWEK